MQTNHGPHLAALGFHAKLHSFFKNFNPDASTTAREGLISPGQHQSGIFNRLFFTKPVHDFPRYMFPGFLQIAATIPHPARSILFCHQ
jgi:hypothetical protein